MATGDEKKKELLEDESDEENAIPDSPPRELTEKEEELVKRFNNQYEPFLQQAQSLIPLFEHLPNTLILDNFIHEDLEENDRKARQEINFINQGYCFAPFPEKADSSLRENILYVQINEDELQYKVVRAEEVVGSKEKKLITAEGVLSLKDLCGEQFSIPKELNDLDPLLPSILQQTFRRGYTTAPKVPKYTYKPINKMSFYEIFNANMPLGRVENEAIAGTTRFKARSAVYEEFNRKLSKLIENEEDPEKKLQYQQILVLRELSSALQTLADFSALARAMRHDPDFDIYDGIGNLFNGPEIYFETAQSYLNDLSDGPQKEPLEIAFKDAKNLFNAAKKGYRAYYRENELPTDFYNSNESAMRVKQRLGKALPNLSFSLWLQLERAANPDQYQEAVIEIKRAVLKDPSIDKKNNALQIQDFQNYLPSDLVKKVLNNKDNVPVEEKAVSFQKREEVLQVIINQFKNHNDAERFAGALNGFRQTYKPSFSLFSWSKWRNDVASDKAIGELVEHVQKTLKEHKQQILSGRGDLIASFIESERAKLAARFTQIKTELNDFKQAPSTLRYHLGLVSKKEAAMYQLKQQSEKVTNQTSGYLTNKSPPIIVNALVKEKIEFETSRAVILRGR